MHSSDQFICLTVHDLHEFKVGDSITETFEEFAALALPLALSFIYIFFQRHKDLVLVHFQCVLSNQSLTDRQHLVVVREILPFAERLDTSRTILPHDYLAQGDLLKDSCPSLGKPDIFDTVLLQSAVTGHRFAHSGEAKLIAPHSLLSREHALLHLAPHLGHLPLSAVLRCQPQDLLVCGNRVKSVLEPLFDSNCEFSTANSLKHNSELTQCSVASAIEFTIEDKVIECDLLIFLAEGLEDLANVLAR